MRYLLLCLLSFSLVSFTWAETFRIDDIRIEGLKRVSAKQIFSALPIKVNSEASPAQLQDAVRAVFKTGFFSEIDIARDGNILIVGVVERPAINRIEVSGNSVLETEPLLEGLKGAGLVEGDIFKQSSLDFIERELNAQYSAIGRYATKIDMEVTDLPQNQVNIAIDITEGKTASIKYINIVGNKDFSEDDLQLLFQIKTTGRWSWITGNDKYAQQRLSGDLERLKSFYLNQGYLEFEVTSTQVSLSPDKETVYITVNIFEGQPYTINAIALAGDPIVSEEEINELITISEGETFAQEELFNTSKAIEKRLGNLGYSYAKVRGVPELNKDEKTAKITFFIDPGTINYVRRIIFRGNTTTQDNVLRREMRQLEGAPVSTEKLAQSKARLERLPLFSEVRMRTQPVPGRPDQVDIIFTVVEQPSGSVNASIGFSQGSGVTFSAGLQQSNWLGTGNTLGFQVANSDVETAYTFNYTNPYFTQDGVSRSLSLFFRERDLEELDISSFSTDRIGADLTFGYPTSENSRVSFGVGIEKISIEAGTEAAQEISESPRLRSGVANETVTNAQFQAISSQLSDTNGNGFFDEEDIIPSGVNAGAAAALDTAILEDTPSGFLDIHGDDFASLNFTFGWRTSTLNRGVFPTKGGSQRLNLEVTAPGGDLEYFKLIYRGQLYRALTKNLTVRLRSRFGYADSYGDIDELPFFENFFAGGNGSVRGFEASSLGPKGTIARSFIAVPTNVDDRFAYVLNSDATGLQTFTNNGIQTLGGNILVESSIELIFPVPFSKNTKSVRTLLFIDAGNVFSDSCGPTQANCSNLDLGKLSSAYGAGIQWLSPIGPVSVYITKALQEQPFDEAESFQFSLGQSF